jgi:hypothetical protein
MHSHRPYTQLSPAPQTWQALLLAPQAAVVLPASQAPVEGSVQPLQVCGLQT